MTKGDVPAVDLSRAVWQKSIYSAESDCVEVAFVNGKVAVRDSKDRRGAVLFFTPGEWRAFTAGVRDGQFQEGHPSPQG